MLLSAVRLCLGLRYVADILLRHSHLAVPDLKAVLPAVLFDSLTPSGVKEGLEDDWEEKRDSFHAMASRCYSSIRILEHVRTWFATVRLS